MFGFGKADGVVKDYDISKQYDQLSKRISDLAIEIATCQNSLKLQGTDLADLRGTINSRLAKIRARTVEQEPETEKDKSQEELGIG